MIFNFGHKVYSAEWVTKKYVTITGKLNLPEAVRKEIEVSFLYEIASRVKKHKIPPSLVINLDQTPTKLVPGSKSTQALIGSMSVPLKGATDKRAITATFSISLEGDFLPIKLIHGGKTSKSIPHVEFIVTKLKHLNCWTKLLYPTLRKSERSNQSKSMSTFHNGCLQEQMI